MFRKESSFAPIVDNNSCILILGSFPSVLSVKHDFYYANKRNQFWPIMNEIFFGDAKTNLQRKNLVLHNKIALWDSVRVCERKNSSDSELKVMEGNDIKGLLEKYSQIHTIFFNGKKSQQVYNKYHKDIDIYTKALPSTSPAHAAMKYEEKLQIYQKNIEERLL
ncbi:DNA-deoxyinosine glycosylase [Candidatus Uabimicrobium amorphum]|uniref:DNA-deoxyinosine glycosylase n=1 Tax=Uabimicrobium amorphum TaxID=2596890 RepID=A0A5S9IMY7_UABAM|nr:DNA-deoxyinosine glycosylase [Candidatus Uabimicrobium amorphum]BBM84829.1 DNA-deoxyinosine glycosylase [Candidatus Uabimicrobium amorphum]